MDAISAYLPQHEGLLPKWLLLVSVISALNSAQAYKTLHFTQRVYSGSADRPSLVSKAYPNAQAPNSPVTPLMSRTFGTWTFLSSVIRMYAAYHIDEPVVYQLALWTYGIAWSHFVSEWLVFRSASWGAGLASPVIVATSSLCWMLSQWGFYVQ